MVQNEKNTGRRPLVTESHTVPFDASGNAMVSFFFRKWSKKPPAIA
jgi:hypothetical protein